MPALARPSKRFLLGAALVYGVALGLAGGCDRFVVIGGYGDAGPRGGLDGGADGGGHDAGPNDGGRAAATYTLSGLVVTPHRVTAGQPGVTLRFDVTNRGPAALARVEASVSVNGSAPSAAGLTLTSSAGQSALPIAAGETRTLRYDVALASGEVEAGPGTKSITVGARAFAAPADGGEPVDLGGASGDLLLADLVIDARPAPLITARMVDGVAALYLGERAAVIVEIANTGEAALVLDDGAPQLSARDAAGNLFAGVTLAREGAAPARLAGGERLTLAYTLRVDAVGAATAVFLVRACAGGRDANYVAASRASPTYFSCAGDAAIEMLGLPPVVMRAVATDLGMVTLGQTDVLVHVILENTGAQPLRLSACVDPSRLPNANCNPRVRFVAAGAAGPGEAPVDVTDSGFTFDAFTPAPAGLTLGSGETLSITAAFGVRAAHNGQVGRNVVQSSLAYTRAGGAVLGYLPSADAAADLWVVFQPGPILDAPYGEHAWGFGTALAGLGDVAWEASLWPGIAVGAPGWDNGAGAAYFYQLVPDGMRQSAVLVGQTFGFAQHHLGAALGPLGNWNRVDATDRSSEVAIGRPGASYLAVYDVERLGVLDDPYPASFTPCAPGCELGAALATNVRGRNEALGETVPLANRRILAAGAPDDAGGLGRVDVLRQRLSSEPRPPSEPPGATLHTRIFGEAPGERFGAALALADVDGDGDLDLLVGAPAWRRGAEISARGRVHLVSAPLFTRDGAAFATLEGEAADDGFGAAIAGLGDIDGDGRDDVAVGAPAANDGAGRVYVFSGATGARLYVLEGRVYPVPAPGGGTTLLGERFGASLASLYRPRSLGDPASDFNQDGLADFAVGAPMASPRGKVAAGAIYVFSAPGGADGRAQALLVYHGEGAGDAFGSAIAAAGDVNADGFQDLLAAAPTYVAPADAERVARGRVYVLPGGAARTVPVGGGL